MIMDKIKQERRWEMSDKIVCCHNKKCNGYDETMICNCKINGFLLALNCQEYVGREDSEDETNVK